MQKANHCPSLPLWNTSTTVGRGQGGPGTLCTQDSAEKANGPGGHANALCLCRKLTHTTSETKSLQRSLQQAQERKAQLEDEIIAYEERMKKLNMELKKLQGFHQQSELEVRGWWGWGSGRLPVKRSARSPFACRII